MGRYGVARWAVGLIDGQPACIDLRGAITARRSGHLGTLFEAARVTFPEMPDDDDMAGWDAWASAICDQANVQAVQTRIPGVT